MDYRIFNSIVEQLKELPNLEWVHFGGFGEPLSHPHIIDMIRQVKGLGLKVEMISNGSLLTPDMARTLIDLGLDMLFISLDGPDEEAFNDIRKGADFVSVIDNIKGLNKIKHEVRVNHPELGIEFVAMKRNFHKLPQVAKLITELNAKKLLVTNVMPYNEELRDEILYDLNDTEPLFGKDSVVTLMKATMPNMKLRSERYCKFIEDKALTVTWEGKVAPCYALMHGYRCFVYGREKKIYPYYLGDVQEKSLKEIWTKPEYALFRMRILDSRLPSCTDCRELEGCSYTDDNQMDCWGNSPSCAECLWARRLIVCP
jgi:tungsten cofactor oxidoreducase radical SAM maturase